MHLRFRLTLTVLVVSILVVLNSEQVVAAKNSTTEEFPNEYQSHLEYVLELRNLDDAYQRISPIIKNELFSTINQTSTDQNITLTIHDIYYFGNQFTYSYTLETEKDVNSDVWEHRSVLGSFKTEFDREWMNSNGSFWDKEVSDGKYVGYATINFRKALPPKGELTLTFPQLFNTKGNWEVRFPVKEVSGENVDISSIENIDPSKVDVLSAKKNDAELQVLLEVTSAADAASRETVGSQ
ncbi:hypothetical protein J2S78_000493 [Salibacterium salarium]|uniref:DUF4179 domain-containing protein n=1 Tax=Salibacterium salarium TaxID=284579 RepID=UPI0027852F26|nr:DUF4179 domain-containing protein [Salibacterium salarium]MDQ0298085.1 hypothetical protein [Salibacterium salarium]